MVNPNRGDYTVGFKGRKAATILTMMPNVLDATHRSFYAEDDGRSMPTTQTRRQRVPRREVNKLTGTK
jgi:hypothetical protein